MVWMEGTEVEVSRNEEWLTDAWYKATIVKSSSSNKNAKALVQYQTLGTMELIPKSCIRPIPPSSSSSETFGLNDVVDAFYRGGWWAGVITQVLPNSSFSVLLHRSPDNNNLRFDSSALRFNVFWVNGIWFRSKKREVITTAQYPEKPGHSSNTTNTPIKAIGLESSGCGAANDKAEERTLSRTKSGKNLIEQTTPRKEIISCVGISTNKKLKQATPRSDATISRPLKRAKKRDATEYNGREKIETKQQEVEDGNHTVDSIKMKGSPPNLHVNSSPTSLGDAVGKNCTCDEIELPTNSTGFQDASAGNIVGVSETDCRRENAIIAITEISNDVICYDQPLHMCSGEIELDDSRISSGGTMNQWDEARESQVGLPQIDCTDNKVLRLNSKLPFVKSSPIWEMIDSMEVFQAMQQCPHFHPLYDFTEGRREGLAIGQMVTFANLVEKTRKLQLDDPRSIWVSYLEVLDELETHGFDVQVLRNRLNELLAIKDRQEQNLDKFKKCESRLLEDVNKNSKIDEEIEEFIKKIREFKEKRASTRSIKKIQDTEIATSQLRADYMLEGIRSTQLDFGRVTIAPW